MACSSSSPSSSAKKARRSRAKVRRRRVKEGSLRRWVARARGKGLSVRELVFDLHVRRGMRAKKVAEVLGLGVEVVRKAMEPKRRRRGVTRAEVALWSEGDLLARAPRTKGDFAGLRERISVALWETVVATFAEVMSDGEKEGEGAAREASGPMVSVRIRALKQISKLYGVGGRRRRSAAAVEPEMCATPEEIAGTVREWRRRRGVDDG